MIARRLFLVRSSNRVQCGPGSCCRRFGTTETKPDTPRLSRRSRQDLFALTVGAAAAGTYLFFSHDLDHDLRTAVDSLLLSDSEESMPSDWAAGQDMSDELPPAVKRYLHEVLPTQTNPRRHMVSVTKQSGKFLAAQVWYPFEATLMIKDSFGDPAFVWSATTTIFGMPQQILQSLLGGRASIKTKAWGKIPTVQVQEEEPFVLFWLAMLPLCPQALLLLPNQFEQQRLVWTVHDPHTARARLITYPDKEEYHLEFEFDPTSHLLQSIAVRANCLQEPWKASYRDYRRLRGQVVAPSQIEIGKGEGPRFRHHMMFFNWPTRKNKNR